MEENITSICSCLFIMFLLVCLYALLYNLPLMFLFVLFLLLIFFSDTFG